MGKSRLLLHIRQTPHCRSRRGRFLLRQLIERRNRPVTAPPSAATDTTALKNTRPATLLRQPVDCQGETAAYVRDQRGHSSIKVTFDTYGHLFPGRGKEASARYETSMADAKVRHKAEASVSNPLAIDREEGPEGTVTN